MPLIRKPSGVGNVPQWLKYLALAAAWMFNIVLCTVSFTSAVMRHIPLGMIAVAMTALLLTVMFLRGLKELRREGRNEK